MLINCICKASIKEGLGHLIRSITFANKLSRTYPNLDITLILISDLDLEGHFKDVNFSYSICKDFGEIGFNGTYDCLFIDMLFIKASIFKNLQKSHKKIISLSPIFNMMSYCDILITRTKYLGATDQLPMKYYAGLDYSIIRPEVKKIDPTLYTKNLSRESLHIGISMGGTDPNNLTLSTLKILKNISIPVVFWVLLGEGYKHQYDDLVKTIKENTSQEIILARTNRHMWEILSNCSLAILAGGLTSYEAAYAGLPSINFFRDKNKSYLIKELQEKKLTLGSSLNLESIPELITSVSKTKDILISINKNTQGWNPLSVKQIDEIITNL